MLCRIMSAAVKGTPGKLLLENVRSPYHERVTRVNIMYVDFPSKCSRGRGCIRWQGEQGTHNTPLQWYDVMFFNWSCFRVDDAVSFLSCGHVLDLKPSRVL